MENIVYQFTEYTPGHVQIMREWLKENNLGTEIEQMLPETIIANIDAHFSGGITEFMLNVIIDIF